MDTPLPKRFVSTGSLPPTVDVASTIEEAYELFLNDDDGACSAVYPALEKVDPKLFGICIAGTDGQVWSAGDVETPFTIMSVSKPFVFALVCQAIGAEEARRKLGANATGHAFNSILPLENGADGKTNPMVNTGAIATTSLVPGETFDAKWDAILHCLSAFAGRALTVNAEILDSALATNLKNRGLAHLLDSLGLIYSEPMAALELYTRQCCLEITTRDLAIMGATLAAGGVNPITRRRVVDASSCRYVLAVMATAGIYEASGDWLYDVGLPGKSGIGGGIVTVSPGKGGVAAFSPKLDKVGNSVRAQRAIRHISHGLGIDLFVSEGSAVEGFEHG